jgi:hypothetical protein
MDDEFDGTTFATCGLVLMLVMMLCAWACP